MPGRIRRNDISMSCRATAAQVSRATSISPAPSASIPRRAPCSRTASRRRCRRDPIHTSVDKSGDYLLTAYNDPSNVDRASHQERRHPRRGGEPAGQARCRHLRTPGPHHAGKSDRDPGEPRQQCRRRQAGRSGRAQALRIQGRRADEPRLDRARKRARLRAAASRFSPDPALGLRVDRAAEQALCLPAPTGRRARP